MLRSLHTVSSGARHAIQPHLLSIELWPRNFNAFKFSCSVPRLRCPRASPSSFLVRMQCNAVQYNTLQYNAMQCNAIHYNTMQCNAMQWHSPTLEKNAMSCSVPRIRCPRALTMPSSSIMQWNAVQYNTSQYNAMQCNAIDYNITQ